MKFPLDRTPYPRHPRSQRVSLSLKDGLYVYVQDTRGDIYVVPDGPHLHPKVLGGGLPAMYAGDMTVERREIKDITNLSGTFQFDDRQGLLSVSGLLEQIGFPVRIGAVRFFPVDGSRPEVLR